MERKATFEGESGQLKTVNDLPDLSLVVAGEEGVGGEENLSAEAVLLIEGMKSQLLASSDLSDRYRNQLLVELDRLRGIFHRLISGYGTFRNDNAYGEALGKKSSVLRETELVTDGVVGRSPKIAKIMRLISKLAHAKITLLLEGETGVGKELFAKIIHLNSKRSKFVAVNCGAFPEGTLESELFGHVKGAFTGAVRDRKGKFMEADGGTIFLDEIGELDLLAQVKLLRVLEVGEVQKVGADEVTTTDIRVVAATNRDLQEMVEKGEFREDLYYRLSMAPINIPPLRERRDEINLLLEFFFAELCELNNREEPILSYGLQRFILDEYHYPGNIRELKNIAYFISMFFDGKPVEIEDLPERYWKEIDTTAGSLLDKRKGDAEYELIVKKLKLFKGRVKPVYEEMGISRSGLYQLMKKHNIMAAEYRE